MTSARMAAAVCFIAISVGGCREEKGGGRGPAADVEEALTRLGVDITATPRTDANGQPVPEDYSPVGPTTTQSRIDELLVVGVQLEDPNAPATYLPGKASWLEAEGGQTTVLHSPAADPTWVDDTQPAGSFAQTKRSLFSCNVNGDGIEETVVAHVVTNGMTGDAEIHIVVYEDGLNAAPYSETSSLVHTQVPAITDLRGAAYDADGDGDDDLALALSSADAEFKVLFLVNQAGVFGVDAGATLTVAPLSPGPDGLSTSVASAQLDPDGGKELVLTLMEHTSSPSEAGVARYMILDDAGREFRELASDYVTAFGQGQLRSAVAADVAAGDIDNDGLDEIVIGGPIDYATACVTTSGSIHFALDDGLRAFNRIGEGYQSESWTCETPDFNVFRWTHVTLVDVDGDLIPEVSVGRRVFEDWAHALPFSLLHAAPEDMVTPYGNGWLDRNAVDVVGGDFTGDGYEELAVYAPQGGVRSISYWGRNGPNFVKVASHPVIGADGAVNPVLLPVNLDNDSTVLSWNRIHKLVFTEPIVLAALAAPPCFEGIGQNLDGCVTTYGRAESETIDKSLVLSLSLNSIIGVNVDGGAVTQTEFEVIGTFTRTLSFAQNWGYTLSRSIVYTTGPQEDSVIFTTIPYDQYIYTAVSHPDPDMVGKEIVVSIPREMITLIAERTYYNESVTADALRVDHSVFNHRIGSPQSYPTVAERDAILASRGGLATQQSSVGQGAGATEVGLAVGTEYGIGGSLELGYELEVQATVATLVAGFTVGYSAEAALSITSGTETTYTGSVGSIPASEFGGDHLYNFGLFTYVYPDPNGQEYEVINYWVD